MGFKTDKPKKRFIWLQTYLKLPNLLVIFGFHSKNSFFFNFAKKGTKTPPPTHTYFWKWGRMPSFCPSRLLRPWNYRITIQWIQLSVESETYTSYQVQKCISKFTVSDYSFGFGIYIIMVHWILKSNQLAIRNANNKYSVQ